MTTPSSRKIKPIMAWAFLDIYGEWRFTNWDSSYHTENKKQKVIEVELRPIKKQRGKRG